MKRVESELLQPTVEERFRLLADAAPVMVWVSGPDRLRSWFNQFWLAFRGRTMEEELGDGWSEGVHPEDHDRCVATYATAFERRARFEMDYRLRRSDGQFRWVLDRGVPHFDAAGRFAGYVGSCIDIHERREAEQRAKASEQRLALALAQLELVLEATGTGTWETDLLTGRTMRSEVQTRLFGLKPSPSPERWEDGFDRVHPEDQPEFRAIFEAARRGEIERFEQECRVVWPSGELRWLHRRGIVVREADGQPRWIRGVALDVTERKRSEEANGHLAAIVASSNDAIMSLTLEGRIMSWNPAAERLFGHGGDEMHGRLLASLVPEDSVAAVTERIAAVRAGDSTRLETTFRHQSGEPVAVALSAAPVRASAGTVFAISVVARDIGASKRQEERRNVLIQELNHRVKNTLSILQSIAMQTLKGVDAAKRQDFLSRLMALSRCHDLLTDTAWENAELGALLLRTLAPYRSDRASERLALNGPLVRLPPSTALSLALALHELATNAVKYGALSVPAGRVAVDWQIEPRESGQALRINWREHDGPPVVPPQEHGFGSRLLRGLGTQAGASVQHEFRPDGVVCAIALPLKREKP
ncbi:MAG: PAS domain S-box protein [Alphaproteobacteria bacterium]|nr:PAS domain S-box protein [Alphaproteobacteria bacterium]